MVATGNVAAVANHRHETLDLRLDMTALRALTRSDGAPEPAAAPAHFRRQFKARTGTSPKAFQVAQRITRAKESLAAGRSLKETAARLGFGDVFHFTRLFRRVTNQTAGQFAAVFTKGPPPGSSP
jgi:AraC-like DNA-binding protein